MIAGELCWYPIRGGTASCPAFASWRQQTRWLYTHGRGNQKERVQCDLLPTFFDVGHARTAQFNLIGEGVLCDPGRLAGHPD